MHGRIGFLSSCTAARILCTRDALRHGQKAAFFHYPINRRFGPPKGYRQASIKFKGSSCGCSRLADLRTLGTRDKVLNMYCEWQCAGVDDPELKEDFRVAYRITLYEGFDLQQVYKDQNINLYVRQGVKPGIARSFVEDIKIWADTVEMH
ncbi:hypothetical protein BGZ63DRAFT_379600 [Mariannaea sp. PMI_226]|nr:hypothetical protein BGZ63DRAFT_379600 [Mariannaea sp. PMI_226]